MKISGLDHLVLNVDDLEEMMRFYHEILGMEILRLEEFSRKEVPFPSVRVSQDVLIDLVRGARKNDANNVDHFCLTIEHTDINSILRVGSTMYFGTMFGLLYLDLYNRDWNLIGEMDGLNDSAIWDMLEYNGSIFVATANGVNEVSIVNHSIIPDRYNIFEDIIRLNIYELQADSQYL